MSKSKRVEPEFVEIQKDFQTDHLVDEAMDDIIDSQMTLKEVLEALALSAKAEGYFEEAHPNAHADEITYCNDGKRVTWSEVQLDAFGDDDNDTHMEHVLLNIEDYTDQELIDLQLAIVLELGERIESRN